MIFVEAIAPMSGLCTELSCALSLLPAVPAVMTSAFENKRSGILAQRVMLCAEEPPCLAIAVPKGHRIATLVRDSHSFCLNLVDPKQRLLVKKFEHGCEADAFELLEHRTLSTGAPCLARALACLDCEVMRHFDLEADHEIYIGQIMKTWVPSKPAAVNTACPNHAPVVNGTAHGPAHNGVAKAALSALISGASVA